MPQIGLVWCHKSSRSRNSKEFQGNSSVTERLARRKSSAPAWNPNIIIIDFSLHSIRLSIYIYIYMYISPDLVGYPLINGSSQLALNPQPSPAPNTRKNQGPNNCRQVSGKKSTKSSSRASGRQGVVVLITRNTIHNGGYPQIACLKGENEMKMMIIHWNFGPTNFQTNPQCGGKRWHVLTT